MAVTAGTILGGIFGAFIAVPLAAIVNNVVNDIHGFSPGEPAAVPQT
jgi:predicted PurR-regulated permease PerM